MGVLVRRVLLLLRFMVGFVIFGSSQLGSSFWWLQGDLGEGVEGPLCGACVGAEIGFDDCFVWGLWGRDIQPSWSR